LQGGFYQARSIIANAQRCLNLYPEKNPEDAEAPFTMYLTPGLRLLRAGGAADGPVVGQVRGAYFATNGVLFVVVKNTLYVVNSNWVFNGIATLTTNGNPVSMMDNGSTLFVVDGSPAGLLVDLGTLAVTAYGAVDNYLGADRVDYLDTFMLFNQPGTRNFYSTLSSTSTIDPLYIAGKVGQPDRLATLIVMHREIWLLGTQLSTEIWYDAGGVAFPFQITPGVFVEQGCLAKYSVCKHDLMVFWLGRDRDGQLTVFVGTGYAAKRISTPAIAALLSSRVTTPEDAIGMVYKQMDHSFYMLSFPTDDLTVVYDISEGLWHERAWIDSNGVEHRHRANCTALAHNGTVVAGDWENGNLYALDLAKYVDEVNGTEPVPGQANSVSPIVRRRGFPHINMEGRRTTHAAVRFDMQCGEAAGDITNVACFLRWSDNRGRTWGDPVETTLGLVGDYIAQPRFGQLGMARDRVYEIFWDAPVNTALQGIWLDLVGAAS
jgi:hypothetical protein